jgi:hypothetical protein
MRRRLTSGRAALALLGTLALAACEPGGGADLELAARVDSLATAYWQTYIEIYPEEGTTSGLANAEHGRIRDNSLIGIRVAQARVDALRDSTLAIDPAPLEGTAQEVTYAVLRDALDSERDLMVCGSFMFCV